MIPIFSVFVAFVVVLPIAAVLIDSIHAIIKLLGYTMVLAVVGLAIKVALFP